jgi:hypothetical protein
VPAAKQKETIIQPQETPTPESSPTANKDVLRNSLLVPQLSQIAIIVTLIVIRLSEGPCQLSVSYAVLLGGSQTNCQTWLTMIK